MKHTVQNGHEISDLLKKCPAEYRYGFTGTMPSDELTRMQIKSYLGPMIVDYSASYLADLGFVAKCNISTYSFDYKKEFFGDFNKIKDEVIKTPFRLNKIKEILTGIDESVLLLTTKVEKEGELLFQWLKEQKEFKKKKIVFLSGKSKTETREMWRKECDKRKNVIIVATYGIFSTGINIKSLKHLVLASSTKSEIRTLQSIGRALRSHENKKDGAFIYDLVDNVKYLKDHAKERVYYYKQERFEVNAFKFVEI